MVRLQNHILKVLKLLIFGFFLVTAKILDLLV
jgi:hypothetical protein